MSASVISWEAVGATAAALSLVYTLYLAWRGGKRSLVSWEHDEVSGSLNGDRIYAHKLLFQNHGRHLRRFQIRIDGQGKALSFEIASARSVDPKSIKIIAEADDLVLISEDIPRGEWFELDIFSCRFLLNHSPKGGTSEFSLIRKEKLNERRIRFAFLAVLIISVLIQLLDINA